ncbi:hypothetical protein HYZ70_02090 [Candidatus Curtissbacteria bacterium]|nr:hypothetical protein [Candidatus Curtissbacteria bacterium]
MEMTKPYQQYGQALLASVFLFGILLLAGSLSLATVGVVELQQKLGEEQGDQALFAARSGIEEMLYRLGSDVNYGATQSATISSSSLNNSTYIATISGNSSIRIATASGLLASHTRRLEVRLDASPSAGNISLAYAAQVGQGGIQMSNGSQIAGSGGSDGNVYSNGVITGANNATIQGNAWAVNGINPSGGGIVITKNAYGSVIKNCTVNGNTYSPTLPTNCTVSGSKIISPAPSAIAMPIVDIAYWQNAATAGGTLASYSLNSGNASLGPKIITGDVTISNSAILTITGALWVHGTFTMSNGAIVKLADSFGQNGTVILLDHPTDKANKGKLVISNTATVLKNSSGGYILFVSTNQHNDCSVLAVSISNNSTYTATIAKDGCVQIANSGTIVAIAARQLVLTNNTQIAYETGLSSELYVPGPGIGGASGFGWHISSWNEIP